MDHAIVSHDIRGGDFCFVDHDAAHGGDRDFRALHGFDIAGFHVCSHHFTGNNMVGKDSSQLCFVLEQGIQIGFGNFCKGSVCGRKDRERSLAFEGVDQSSGGKGSSQGFK